MARKPFVVLDAEMLSSSVWSEAAHVRLVWITLLILCDTEGYVGAAVPGIARAAGVPLEQAVEAIEKLQQPDPYSRTKAHEGRRLEVSERGFRVLNFIEHLDRLSAERTRSRERVRMHRKRKALKQANTNTDEQIRSGSREQGPENREERITELPIIPSKLPLEGGLGGDLGVDAEAYAENRRNQYAEAFFEAWRKRRGGGALVISPADYALIDECLKADVPLRIVLRGIADCAGKPGPKTPLVYAGPSVREAIERWRVGMGGTA